MRARWGITPLLAAPAGAWALGLGDIELQSALNQPFRAEIALSATADELEGLRVTLAGDDMFARRGLDRPAFLSNLEFRVVADRNGRNVIQVTSRDSIAEPFVTLLVEASWPRGRNIKEYTVLLDPPVFLPAPAAPPAVRPVETRPSTSSAPGGAITRPAAPPPAETPRAPAPAPAVREPMPSSSSTTQPAPRAPVEASGGTYGPVQRAETLWAIADRLRPDGTSINQMMIAIYEANPAAFGGNINVLRAGSTLRVPDSSDLATLTTTVANAEVRRQTDEWQNRTPGGQLRLLPPEAEVARAPAPAPAVTARAPTPRAAEPPPAAADAGANAAVSAGLDESRRAIELRNAELQNLQNAAAAANENSPPADSEAAAPGVDIESEPLFADETEASPPPVVEGAAPAPAPVVTPPAAAEPSLVSRALDWLGTPLLWMAVGAALLLFSALWFVRRRRQDTEDVTGRWEALESETDDDQESRDATERMRRQLPEQTIVVEEQHAQQLRPAAPEPEQAPARRAATPRPQRAAPVDETLSSQTVINLDQADAVAEADFHIAYGLYDQAAELVQKALEASPDRRDLKLKLLEVYFMWGNKDAFVKAAQALRADIGQTTDDPDWNKVVIMGRQICPDERLFTDATPGAGRVDVDLEAGDSPLDLAFDEAAASADHTAAVDATVDFPLEASDQRPALRTAKPSAKPRDFGGDALDIGARTAAGLEAALFEDLGQDDKAGRTTPDLAADSLAVTQESPTVERAAHSDWATVESPTIQYGEDAPTVETPTIESPAANSSTTMATKTVAVPRRSPDQPTVEQPALAPNSADYTAEIDLDDLGLDVKDIEELPSDLGDLPMAGSGETDTRQQPALREDDSLLSATGVTKVLHGEEDMDLAGKTAIFRDQDATLLAPSYDEGTSTLTGTEVIEDRLGNDESGSTSLVKSLRGKDARGDVDLDLADLTAALHGAETIEQPRSSFSRDVFGGGDTPVDLDIGADTKARDDDPTGTEEVGLDPQTMTEVGTKLDLARAYIDMGDPEGARSILEEVLDEGDPSQRREAQSLIDALGA
jgi:pilus assembly protein FimV